jgi:hypothetical protein
MTAPTRVACAAGIASPTPPASWRRMKLFTRQPSPTEQLKNAAIEAAIGALVDSRDEPKRRSGLSGSRAVAAGAVLYAAGFAALKGRSLLREQLSANRAEEAEETRAREEDDEPEVEEYEQEPQAAEEDEEPDVELEPEEDEEEDEPEASEEDESEEDDDQGGDERGDDEPEAGGDGPSGDAGQEAEADDDSEELEAEGRQEHDDETSLKAPTPLPKRQPKRRAARRKGAQPSLELPRQRWPRMPAGRR